VAEQLRLDEMLRERRAVDLEERLVTPVAACVNCPGHDVLARTTLTAQEDRHRACPRYLLDRRHELTYRIRSTDELDISELPTLLFLEAGHPLSQAPRLESLLDGDQEIVEVRRLLQEIVGARLHRLDRRLDLAIRRYHDDHEITVQLAKLLEQLQAVGVRQSKVQQHERGRRLLHQPERSRSSGRRVHRVSGTLEVFGQPLAGELVIVNDGDHRTGGHGDTASCSGLAKAIVNTDPCPASLRTSSHPP
jgi:hypothetical protein